MNRFTDNLDSLRVMKCCSCVCLITVNSSVKCGRCRDCRGRGRVCFECRFARRTISAPKRRKKRAYNVKVIIPQNQRDDIDAFHAIETEELDSDTEVIIPPRPYRASQTGGKYVEALTTTTSISKDVAMLVMSFLHDLKPARKKWRKVLYEIIGRSSVVRKNNTEFIRHVFVNPTFTHMLLDHARRFICKDVMITNWDQFIIEVSCQFQSRFDPPTSNEMIPRTAMSSYNRLHGYHSDYIDHKWYLLSASSDDVSQALRRVFAG